MKLERLKRHQAAVNAFGSKTGRGMMKQYVKREATKNATLKSQETQSIQDFANMAKIKTSIIFLSKKL